MLLRPQIAETAAGKLSEEYQFSPRVILELRGAGNFDGRLRYWHYDRNSDVSGDHAIRADRPDSNSMCSISKHSTTSRLANLN